MQVSRLSMDRLKLLSGRIQYAGTAGYRNFQVDAYFGIVIQPCIKALRTLQLAERNLCTVNQNSVDVVIRQHRMAFSVTWRYHGGGFAPTVHCCHLIPPRECSGLLRSEKIQATKAT